MCTIIGLLLVGKWWEVMKNQHVSSLTGGKENDALIVYSNKIFTVLK
jgi:hypothetical protein